MYLYFCVCLCICMYVYLCVCIVWLAARVYTPSPPLHTQIHTQWGSSVHKKERKQMIRKFQDYALRRSIRTSFISGDVHLAAVGLLYRCVGGEYVCELTGMCVFCLHVLTILCGCCFILFHCYVITLSHDVPPPLLMVTTHNPVPPPPHVHHCTQRPPSPTITHRPPQCTIHHHHPPPPPPHSDPKPEDPKGDHRWMLNVTSSASVNVPPPNGLVNAMKKTNRAGKIDGKTKVGRVGCWLGGLGGWVGE